MIERLIKAIWAFLKALLKPGDLVEQSCPRGHAMLLGWTECPDCRWIERAYAEQRKRTKSPIRALLFCYQGSHRGQLLSLSGREETFGYCFHYSKVLTREFPDLGESYRISLSQPSVLFSDSALPFRVNGTEFWKETLLDYDELELLGNRFLMLDLQFQEAPSNNQSHEVVS